VVSSGLGGRYPKGVPIGTVVEVNQEKRASVFLRVILKSIVDFSVLEEVFVLGKD
ncbi:MAG: rod shape-determining protein MreC, partial [Gemmatimonadetes bacterium]|nr:rod shape-determining protein MreC [Gemmatimonadota bacterium]